MRAAHARFLGGHGEKRFDQFGIECRAQTDRLRKTRRADGRVAVQAFLVKNHRNAEPRMFDEKFLDRVGQFRRFAGIFADAGVARHAAGVAGAADLSDAMAVFESCLAFLKSKLPAASSSFVGFFLPDAHHLRGLFFQRHARQQILHAPRSRRGGIFVKGNCGGRFFLYARFHQSWFRQISITIPNGARQFNRKRMENSTKPFSINSMKTFRRPEITRLYAAQSTTIFCNTTPGSTIQYFSV